MHLPLQHCHWKISMVLEPREKAFCIAAALPMPCYGPLLTDPSSGSPRTQERMLPFSQSTYSAQCTAQQLTLLQQVLQLHTHSQSKQDPKGIETVTLKNIVSLLYSILYSFKCIVTPLVWHLHAIGCVCISPSSAT